MAPDPRFFSRGPAITVAELAAQVGGVVLRGGEVRIEGVAPLATALSAQVSFVGDRKFVPALAATMAGAVLVPKALVDQAPANAAVIETAWPQAGWAQASALLHHPLALEGTVSRSDVCEDETVVLEPGVVLGEGARIGRGTRIGANTVIGPGVQIGRDCAVGSNVSIGFALIGDRVKLYAGVRLGEAGFGATASAKGPIDIPQLGRVIVQDDVTIGANTCIDRGAFDDTVIGEGTKIDNLVMIGHNCRIGRRCLIVAHTGISGSVTVGDNVVFGGKAGIADHLTIGEGARVAAGAGVLSDIPAGETWSGYPARPLRQFLRETVWLAKQTAGRKKDTGGDGGGQ